MLGQPSLIRESSREKYPWSGIFSCAMSSLSRIDPASTSKNGNGFGDVILHPSLNIRIKQLACATANTKVHWAPFRNMLFMALQEQERQWQLVSWLADRDWIMH